MMTFRPGDRLHVTAGPEGARLMLLGGETLARPALHLVELRRLVAGADRSGQGSLARRRLGARPLPAAAGRRRGVHPAAAGAPGAWRVRASSGRRSGTDDGDGEAVISIATRLQNLPSAAARRQAHQPPAECPPLPVGGSRRSAGSPANPCGSWPRVFGAADIRVLISLGVYPSWLRHQPHTGFIPRRYSHDHIQGRLSRRQPRQGLDQPQARQGAGAPCASRARDDGNPVQGSAALQLRLRRRLPAGRAGLQGRDRRRSTPCCSSRRNTTARSPAG